MHWAPQIIQWVLAVALFSFEGESASCLVVSNSLLPHGLLPTRLLCPWNSPGKNTGVGCHALPQGIFLTQGSNPGLLHCRQILYRLSHQGSPCLRHIFKSDRFKSVKFKISNSYAKDHLGNTWWIIFTKFTNNEVI